MSTILFTISYTIYMHHIISTLLLGMYFIFHISCLLWISDLMMRKYVTIHRFILCLVEVDHLDLARVPEWGPIQQAQPLMIGWLRQ